MPSGPMHAERQSTTAVGVAEGSAGTVLMLSLVHPDFLPSLYAIAGVLRDGGHRVEMVSFSSPLPASTPEAGIIVHDCGQHGWTFGDRLRARSRFREKVAELVRTRSPVGIHTACPFTFLEGVRWQSPRVKVIYHSYELYDDSLAGFLRSPGTTRRNRQVRSRMVDADLICVPSRERAEYLRGHARLRTLPAVVRNVPRLGLHPSVEEAQTLVRGHLPDSVLGKRFVIHTGNASSTQCVLELIESAAQFPPDAALVITNVGVGAYADRIRAAAGRSGRSDDVHLLPTLPRRTMLALQRSSVVGVCLVRHGDNLESSMPAPNKVGEYVHAGLPTVGTASEYLMALERIRLACVVPTLAPESIASGVREALDLAAESGTRRRLEDAASGEWGMDEQAAPLAAILRQPVS